MASKAAVDGANAREAIRTGDRYNRMITASQEAKISSAIESQPKAPVMAQVKPVDHAAEIKANATGVAANKAAIAKARDAQRVASVYYSDSITALASNQSAQAQAIESGRTIARANQAQTAANTQSINKLNSSFASLKNEVNENKKIAAAGSASAMAQANIPQVLNGQTVAFGAGIGGYDGANAVAVGVSFRASENVTVKATVSDDSESNVGYGAGISVGY